MKMIPGIIVALLQVLCPLAIAACFLFWFPRLLDSAALKILSYALGAFYLACAGLVVLGYVLRPKTASHRRDRAR
jgi:hypothetical protein